MLPRSRTFRMMACFGEKVGRENEEEHGDCNFPVPYFRYAHFTPLNCAQFCTPTLRDVPNMREQDQTPITTVVPLGVDSNPLTHRNKPVIPQGWSASWRQIIWEKWKWGLLIALAVVVSRLSASSRGPWVVNSYKCSVFSSYNRVWTAQVCLVFQVAYF